MLATSREHRQRYPNVQEDICRPVFLAFVGAESTGRGCRNNSVLLLAIFQGRPGAAVLLVIPDPSAVGRRDHLSASRITPPGGGLVGLLQAGRCLCHAVSWAGRHKGLLVGPRQALRHRVCRLTLPGETFDNVSLATRRHTPRTVRPSPRSRRADFWADQDMRVTAVLHGLTTQSSYTRIWPRSYSCQRCDFGTQGPISMPEIHADSSDTDRGRPLPTPTAVPDSCPPAGATWVRSHQQITHACVPLVRPLGPEPVPGRRPLHGLSSSKHAAAMHTTADCPRNHGPFSPQSRSLDSQQSPQ